MPEGLTKPLLIGKNSPYEQIRTGCSRNKPKELEETSYGAKFKFPVGVLSLALSCFISYSEPALIIAALN